MDSECLALAVITMDDVAYLISQRQSSQEREEFRTKYNLTELVPQEVTAPSERYEAQTHHAEYHACQH